MFAKLLYIIFNSNFTFKIPKTKKIIFYSNHTNKYLSRYFYKKEIYIFDQNNLNKIYLFIFLKVFFKIIFKLSLRYYYIELFKVLKAEYLISVIDNDFFIYNLKKYIPKLKIIVIQNGYRYNNKFDKYFKELKKKKFKM